MRKILIGALLAAAASFGVAYPVAAEEDCAGSGGLGTPGCEGIDVDGGGLEPGGVTPTPEVTPPAPSLPETSAPAPTAPTAPGQGSLPVTGSETIILAAGGIALIGGGALLVGRSRRAAEV